MFSAPGRYASRPTWRAGRCEMLRHPRGDATSRGRHADRQKDAGSRSRWRAMPESLLSGHRCRAPRSGRRSQGSPTATSAASLPLTPPAARGIAARRGRRADCKTHSTLDSACCGFLRAMARACARRTVLSLSCAMSLHFPPSPLRTSNSVSGPIPDQQRSRLHRRRHPATTTELRHDPRPSEIVARQASDADTLVARLSPPRRLQKAFDPVEGTGRREA